jgi:hypothetical protein
MKFGFLVGASFLVFTSNAARAQDPYPTQCPRGATNSVGIPDNNRASQDACAKAIDLFKDLAPQLAAALAGGNAVLGSGSPSGGLGNFSVGVRVNALNGSLPQVNSTSVSVIGAQNTHYANKSQLIPFPTADATLVISGGIPLGVTNVGTLELLGSAAFLPSINTGGVNVNVPNGSFKFGYGARLGILRESFLIPGLSVSYLTRALPRVDIDTHDNASDTLSVKDLDIKSKSWRVTGSKSLLMFGLVVGAGRDTYEFKGNVNANVAVIGTRASRSVSDVQSARLNGTGPKLDGLTRNNYFADLSMNLAILKIIGEIGQVSGGSITTFNTFGSDTPAKSRVYGSVGVRFGW